MERKFTDDEIVTAMECCDGTLAGCTECPLYHNRYRCKIKQLALDLITRQKAEIERLTETSKEVTSCFHRMESLYNIKCMELKVAKSEAIEDVLLTLEAEALSSDKYIEEYDDSTEQKAYNQALWKAYNLVKEMTEGNNNER